MTQIEGGGVMPHYHLPELARDARGTLYPLAPLLDLVRFIARVEFTPTCWLWTGALFTHNGYGRLSRERGTQMAHRISIEWSRGPVADDLQVDHLCRVRRCVRPSHLEVVTARENVLRSDNVCARNARKAVCSRGHALDYVVPGGRGLRGCRTCRSVANRAFRARRRAAGVRHA